MQTAIHPFQRRTKRFYWLPNCNEMISLFLVRKNDEYSDGSNDTSDTDNVACEGHANVFDNIHNIVETLVSVLSEDRACPFWIGVIHGIEFCRK